MRKGIYRYKKDQRIAYSILISLTILMSLVPKLLMTSTKYFQPVSREELVEIIQKHHPQPKLVKAIIQVESRWNEKAVSNRGAIGLMQVLPSTSQWLTDFSKEDLKCPVKNIIAGTTILKHYQKTSPNLRVALTRYSGGANRYYEKVMKEM